MVAPFAGAWIEIIFVPTKHTLVTVAPFAGAWIEILCLWNFNKQSKSHPSRVRGLKSTFEGMDSVVVMSHPSRVRGLKW